MPETQKSLSITVVIPAFNEERRLGACLDSLSRQTVQPDRVIVVDNNSTDQTAAVARRYPFVTVIQETHQGRAYARNAGFNAVNGEVIARTDADMILPIDWIAHIVHFYADPDHTRLAWTCPGYFVNVRLPKLSNLVLGWFGFGLNRRLLGHHTLWGSSMAITKAQWQAVQREVCDRADIHEDLDLAMHLYRHNYKVYIDHSISIPATLRRLNTQRDALWAYLCMWPRTLKVHHRKSWPIVYVSIVLMRGLFVPMHVAIDRLVRLCGRPKLSE